MENVWVFRHLGFIVKDINKAIELYKSLGFQAETVRNVSINKGEATVNNKPNAMPIVVKVCVIQSGSLAIELVEPVTGDFVHTEFLKNRGEGLNHIAFFVDDFAKEKANMIEKGFPFLFGRGTSGFFDARKIGDVSIELSQKT